MADRNITLKTANYTAQLTYKVEIRSNAACVLLCLVGEVVSPNQRCDSRRQG